MSEFGPDHHPDDEALSRALDGDFLEARAHAETCTACAARLAALAGVAAAVRGSVTAPAPGSEARRQAIQAALGAAVAAEAGAGAAENMGGADSPPPPSGFLGAETSNRSTFLHPESAGGAGGSGREGDDVVPLHGKRRSARGPWLGWAGAAAAVVALIVLATAVIGRSSSSSKSSATSASAPTGGVLNGGDLGAVSDGAQLAGEVAGRLGIPAPANGSNADAAARAAAAASAASPAPSGGSTSSNGNSTATGGFGSGPAGQSAGQAGQAAGQSAGQPGGQTAAGQTPGQSVGAEPTQPAANQPATGAARPECLTQADEAGASRLGRLTLRATLRWDGTPAEVLVFVSSSGQGLSHHLYVMALDGCGLLSVQNF